MNKKILLMFFFLSSLIYARENMTGILMETTILPSETGYHCYISYRIPYNILLFFKDGSKFSTRFNLSFEARDSITTSVIRDISNHSFSVNTYDETRQVDKYLQGVVKLNLLQGVYNILPVFSDEYSQNQSYLKNIYLNLKSESGKEIFNPLVVSEKKTLCNQDSLYVLANYEGNIPFTNVGYNLIIPVKDTTINNISVDISNNDSSAYNYDIKESFIGNLVILNCEGNIVCENSSGLRTKNFILRGFNSKFYEGPLVIQIKSGNKTEKFNKRVIWYDKPYTLRNFSIAAKLLRYVTDDPKVLKINRTETEKSVKTFYDFWKKLDPTPENSFNELLEEFYSRADYAAKEFSVLNTKNGVDSDRGKIYIQYGKPDTIKRLYNDPKFTQEVWFYKNPDRKFVFIDKTGLGNYILDNNQL